MARLDLKVDDKVAILTMDEADNRFNTGMVKSLHEMLDRIERDTDALALVVKSGHSHIWTNGYDLDWLKSLIQKGNIKEQQDFLIRNLMLRKRLLTYPLITVAAMNGHCFGGGVVFSCCFDFRFMRLDRGFFCIPVIDLGYPILPGTRAIFEQALPGHIYRDLILRGRRLTGAECSAENVVSASYNNDEFIDRVIEFAAGLNKARSIVGKMKKVMHAPIVALIEEDAKKIPGGQIVV